MRTKVYWLLVILLSISLVFAPHKSAEAEFDSPNIESKAGIVLEADSGQILYGKNEKEKMYPASLTKIATAIYAIENGNLEDLVTVSKNAVEVDGTTVYLEAGEKVPFKKLIQGMIINSGNDAAIAIAEHISGSVESYSEDINAFLTNVIGVKNTHFVNPHGLFDSTHVTTAKDLAKIIQYAMRNETFMEIFSMKELEWNGKSWDTTIRTHHKLLKGEYPYDGITGGKNGFVSESGYTLATTAEREDLRLIVVTLNSFLKDQVYEDTIHLLDYAFENFVTSQMEEGTTFVVGNHEYIVPKTISYTHALEGHAKEEVTEEGVLKIQDKLLTSEFPLDKVYKGNEKKLKNASVDSVSSNEEKEAIWPYILMVVCGIVIILLLWRQRIAQT